jgi:hypothetical protein
MGYRVRLGRIPKTARKHYAHFKTEQEAHVHFDKGPHACYRPPEHQELIELGKYIDYKKENLAVEDFYNFTISECEFFIVNRDFLLHIIEEYRNNVEMWYRDLAQTLETSDTRQVTQHVKNKISEWDKTHLSHLNLQENYSYDNEDGKLTRSWKFEYAVFNLLYILHTFDWDNDYLIYSGW